MNSEDLVALCASKLRELQSNDLVRVVAGTDTDQGVFLAAGVRVDECSHCSSCAEPGAIGAALAAGAMSFRRVVAVGWSNGGTRVLTPCGGCRELLDAVAVESVCVEVGGIVKDISISKLIPQEFN